MKYEAHDKQMFDAYVQDAKRVTGGTVLLLGPGGEVLRKETYDVPANPRPFKPTPEAPMTNKTPIKNVTEALRDMTTTAEEATELANAVKHKVQTVLKVVVDDLKTADTELAELEELLGVKTNYPPDDADPLA